MKFSEGIQKLLPFGYLFLVVMGILKESVFYYQIGINVLKYSTIMDVLISPIATLTAHPVVFIAVLFMVWVSYAFPALMSKRSDKKWVQKVSSLKNRELLTEEEIGEHFTKVSMTILATAILSFFVGIGYGQGAKLTKKISENKISYDRKLNYNSGESEQVCLFGSNSGYYFYIAKGNRVVKIAPIGAIKSMEITENPMLK